MSFDSLVEKIISECSHRRSSSLNLMSVHYCGFNANSFLLDNKEAIRDGAEIIAKYIQSQYSTLNPLFAELEK